MALVRWGMLGTRVAQGFTPLLRPCAYCLVLQHVAGGQAGPPSWDCHLLTSHRLSEIWSRYYLD